MTQKTEKTDKQQIVKVDKPWLFKPGESGNPHGRPPKELSMTNALREILNEQNPETKIERYKELLNVAMDKAMKGDNDMIKYLINRIEGMPRGDGQVNIGEVEKLVIVVKE